MTEIRCTTSSTIDGKYGIVKAWLKMNHVEYEETKDSAGSLAWTRMTYALSTKQLLDLLAFLREAEVNTGKMADIIV